MTNSYEAPQFIELGKAEVIILDQKQPLGIDSMMIIATEATIDDFDE